ncbi:MAG: hypothetical protein KQI62_15495 [Deltaproteobacteria bacterium]|nr:hypothetical protein [Deltaproteobacteria bacterium]
MKFKYPALETSQKSGEENFCLEGKELPFKLVHFWRWLASDLCSNALRGTVAEFIVGQALGCLPETRVEWDAYDLCTPDGIRIEVKSACYWQSWHQHRRSVIRFGIAPTLGWDAATCETSQDYRRHCDVYVFCLLKPEQKTSVDPSNLDQWEFFVVATNELDQKLPKQKTIGLATLAALDHQKTNYNGLAAAVRKAVGK